MTDITAPGLAPGSKNTRKKAAKRSLDMAAKYWWLVTAVGQWFFTAYIAVFFGSRFFSGGVAAFENTHLPSGYVEGDTVGNLAVATHVLLAAIIIGGGPLQLWPKIRAKFPSFHRWNGRFYMLASLLVSAAGLYMTWFREGGIGDTIQHIGTSSAGVLIFVFAWKAYCTARNRDFKAHRKWALRLFMMVSAVWFVRLMLFGWIFATGGIGIDFKTFSGPFLYFTSYGQWLLPLLLLEAYFWAQERAQETGKFVVSGTLFLATSAMAFGVFAVTAANWIPKIMQ